MRILPLAMTTALFAAGAAHAQDSGSIAVPPNFAPQGFFSTNDDPNTRDIMSTKPATALPPQPPSQPQPWQQQTLSPNPQDMQMPAPRPAAAQAPSRFPSGYVPFGKASAEVTTQVPTGPRNMTAVPVEDVGIVSEDLPPATEQPPIKLSPTDPTEPTAQTAPIFEDDDAAGVKNVVLRGLNKVTAQVSDIEGPVGAVMGFGNLEIIVKSCRSSAKQSMPDYAALLEVRERKMNEEPKLLFSGWMYASSPSVMALEHPVYDLSVVACKRGKGDLPEPEIKTEKKKP